MANVKITDLPTYSDVTAPTSDVMEIVDSTNNVSKQISVQNLAYDGARASLRAGTNVTFTLDAVANTVTINASGGGGGGTFTTITAKWTTANASQKDAYSAPGVVNNDGITINLTASSDPGTLQQARIILGGATLGTTYTIAGTFPNYSITITSADLTGLSAETAPSVTVNIVIGTQYNLNANNLTNRQPLAFTGTLAASYNAISLPYYTTTANINYSYSVTGTATAYGGTITPTGGTAQQATSASGTLTAQPINGATIGGTITGNGQYGAPSATVTLSGSVPAVSTFVPAFYTLTSNSTPPTITTSSPQTPSAGQGSTVTFPTATAASQYAWIVTTRPNTSIVVVTQFGDVPLVPDVSTTQVIAGTSFNVYGNTNLGVGTAIVMRIS